MNIQYNTAKLAKEKGFIVETIDQIHNTFYDEEGTLDTLPYYMNHYDMNDFYREEGVQSCLAPIQSELQTWLREVHKIQIEIEAAWNQEMTEIIGYYYFNYKTWSEKVEIVFKEMKHFDTYEQALEVALLEALKLI